jgi:excisionase family DNA binding protein
MSKRLTLTVPEAAELLGVSRGVAYEAARTGELPGVIRLGRRLLVSRAHLLALLGEQPDLSPNGNGCASTEPVADTPPANGVPGHDEG